MNFNQSDDRRMLADSLDRYLAEQYSIETRHAITKSATGYSPEQWAKFAELGLIGALFTEAQGGFGGTGFDIATVFEDLDEARLPLLFRLLPKELAAETFVEMEPELQELLIRGFSDSELKEVIDELYVDDAAAGA